MTIFTKTSHSPGGRFSLSTGCIVMVVMLIVQQVNMSVILTTATTASVVTAPFIAIVVQP